MVSSEANMSLWNLVNHQVGNVMRSLFPYDNVSTKAKNEDLASLLYTTGYVTRKARTQTNCNQCKELFGNKGNTMDLDPIHFQYIYHLDRGD